MKKRRPGPSPAGKPEFGKSRLIETEISSLDHYGAGRASLPEGSLIVQRALPGDIVKVKINHTKGHFAYADIIQIVKPSEKRINSGCKAFEAGCGGCQWLHLDYEEQIAWKGKLLKNLLLNKAGLSLTIEPVVPMQEPRRSRNKFSLLNDGGRPVFIQENSSKPIALENCPMETAAIQAFYDKLKNIPIPNEILQLHIRGADHGQIGLDLFIKRMSPDVKRYAMKLVKDTGCLSGVSATSYRDSHILTGKPSVEITVGEYHYRVPLNGFFQTNTVQAEVLQKLVIESIPPESNVLLDLYCGVGFFTLPAARIAQKVLGIESNTQAVESAVLNAKLNKQNNAEFMSGDVKRVLNGLKGGIFDTIILDPPRAGLEPEVIAEIKRLGAKTLLYVSCSPESLARDLVLLKEAGYEAVRCVPVDMFPQTFHVETLVILRSSPGKKGKPVWKDKAR